MKNLIQFTLLTLFLAFGFSSLGQAPEGINYQATVRNSSGALMTSQSVTVVFAIRQSSTIGAIIYQENHTVTTNAYGGFNAIIGSGTATTGTFSSINWGTGTYYLSVTVNGNNLGTTQLLSVPYALYSKTSGSSTPGPTGATGPQGPAGATGNTGATGPQGPQGVAGPAGASGTNGTNGAVGPQGPIGLTGPAGSQGPQGIAGAQGATGPQGMAGTNGINGLDGKTIYNGISSPSSSLGTVGDFYINTNTSEIYGPKTVSGWGAGTSLIGNAGPAGANGATGAQGPQGIAGPAGANGTNGTNGVVGPQGPIGLTGPAGSQGPQGIAGATGPQGPAASDDQDIDSVTLTGDLLTIYISNGNSASVSLDSISGLLENLNGTIRQKGGYDTTNFLFGSPQMNYNGNPLHSKKMFFNKEKGAFRVGYSFTTNWDLDSIGNNSFAAGLNSKATGTNSTAMGSSTEATGSASTAMGFSTEATGSASTAMGSGTIATGQNSTAMGFSTEARGSYSNAMGNNTSATGFSATAMGHNTNATGNFSTAIGYNTDATGNTSTAIGNNTDAIGNSSTALGYRTNAIGNYSTAMGEETDAIGIGSTAIGVLTDATGLVSTAMGWYTNATGDYSTAMGVSTNANVDYSTAIGRYNDTTTYGLIFSIGNGTDIVNRYNSMHIFQATNNAYFFGHVSPTFNNTVSLGRPANRWSTLYAVNGTINTSDTTLKTNISPLSYGLSDLMKIKTISYNWKGDERQIKKIGFNAQNLLSIIPEVVQTHSEITNEETGEVTYEENETLGVFYSDMIPVLTKSIQEQQAIIENQEAENQKQAKQLENEKTQNEKQEEELAKLKKEMEELKKQLQLLLDNKEEK
ncbi:MAG: tail fiber domain-containing protein [Flavobacteriales bacterium]